MRGECWGFSAPLLDWPTWCSPFQLLVGHRFVCHDELFHGW
jgi:hypothetical protein